MDVLYVVERDTAAFETARTTVDIVCAGDSLTGWNNFGPAGQWPYRTYPDFLQELCVPLGLRVANGGIAGEISDNGPNRSVTTLTCFPMPGFSSSAWGPTTWGHGPTPNLRAAESSATWAGWSQMVLDRGKQPILFNVPHVNEQMFPPRMAREVHGKRDYHNPQLKSFCDEHGIPLADICCLLRDEHFGDELHPNDRGAKIIAEAVFQVLPKE